MEGRSNRNPEAKAFVFILYLGHHELPGFALNPIPGSSPGPLIPLHVEDCLDVHPLELTN